MPKIIYKLRKYMYIYDVQNALKKPLPEKIYKYLLFALGARNLETYCESPKIFRNSIG